ncbi:MAG: YcxB family protein [Acidobacteriia bacterium]|nr:YcxB family protein [Terriglobia bacterium]
MTPIKLHYTEALIRKAVRLFWWRTIGWRFVAAFLLVLASFVGLLWNGDRSWVVGLLGAVLALAVAFSGALYGIHYRASLGRLRRMRVPEATLELGEESFRMCSDAGTSELAWSAVTGIWSFPEFLLVFLSRAQFITIPTTDIDTGICEFIVGKARAHEAKVA